MKNIFGTEKSDTLYGDWANNNFWTYGGNDVCYGGKGDDSFSDFFGGPDATTGSDKYFGGVGDDFFLTMNGRDKMHGGPGDDYFISYNKGDVVFQGGPGHDELRIAAGMHKDFAIVLHEGSHIVFERDGHTMDVRGIEEISWTS